MPFCGLCRRSVVTVVLIAVHLSTDFLSYVCRSLVSVMRVAEDVWTASYVSLFFPMI